MGALGAVDYRPLALLLDTVIRESFTIPMLTEPDGLRHPIQEADHVVFPIPDVVADFLPQYRVPLVVRIEVHVECINVACTMVVDDDRAASGSVCFASAVRLEAVEPGRIGSDVIDGGEVDGIPSESVE